MTSGRRVYITSCETGDGAWRQNEELLREYANLSRDRRHALVEDPEAAEIILIGNLREEDCWARVRRNPLIARYPGKCFAVCDMDMPVVLLHGVYASAEPSLWTAGRVRTGSYALFHKDFRNPFFDGYVPVGRHEGAPPPYLLTFLGRNSHPVRGELFRHAFSGTDVLIEDTSGFSAFDHNPEAATAARRRYFETLQASRFCLCPRGRGASSVRLFEAMQAGVAPVILADRWVPPDGPDWSRFSIRIPEGRVGEIEGIVRRRENDWAGMGRAAREAYERFFSPEATFDYIVDRCADISRRQRIPERLYWGLRNLYAPAAVLARRIEMKLRKRRG